MKDLQTGSDKKRFHFDNLYFSSPKQYERISLYQIGDLSCQPGFELEEHPQFCYEITYIVSGRGRFWSNGKGFEVEEGDIFIGKPDEIHSGQADAIDPFRYFYLGFRFIHNSDGENPYLHIEKLMMAMDNPLTKDKMGIQAPFLNALKEFNSITQYSHIMIKTYIEQIIILMYRNFFSEWSNTYNPSQEAKGSKHIVYTAISYVDNNILKIKDLSEVSEVIGYSYSYLSHLFSEETGLTLRDYHGRKKLNKAIELLKSGEYNITKIAEMLHYESIHSFSKAFKKSLGISPKEYLNMNLKNTPIDPKAKNEQY
jgi:AraC-like DNA-binding protein